MALIRFSHSNNVHNTFGMLSKIKLANGHTITKYYCALASRCFDNQTVRKAGFPSLFW